MVPKSKTLPPDFQKSIQNKDLTALKKVFDTCDVDAHGGFAKSTALSFRNIPDELARWLVEQGADVNARAADQATPLHAQAAAANGNMLLFLELGAEIEALNVRNETPLHAAVGYYRVQAVRDLVARGANVHAENKRKEMPLAKALRQCRIDDLVQAVTVSRVLLDAGAQITPEMKKSVTRIGKEVALIQADGKTEHWDEAIKAFSELCRQYDMEPVAGLDKHDGVSPIIVKNIAWPAQHQELWALLVPASGYAKTVQGEVIRITGRVSREILDHGGANWDDDYRKMLSALVSHLSEGTPLPDRLLEEATALVNRFRHIAGWEQPDRLNELAVQWVIANPQPISMAQPNYSR